MKPSLEALLDSDQVAQYQDGSYRWQKGNEYGRKPGTFYTAPPQAVLFDTELGMAANRLRWETASTMNTEEFKKIIRRLNESRN